MRVVYRDGSLGPSVMTLLKENRLWHLRVYISLILFSMDIVDIANKN